MAKPQVVSNEEWDTLRADLLKDEKDATHLLDKIAAKRRRLPMTKFSSDYVFDTAEGPKTLLDLFANRRQLAVYNFMNPGPDKLCPGCSTLVDNIPDHALELLAKRSISWVNVSSMPLAQLEKSREDRGWKVSFASSQNNTFADDSGAGNGPQLTMFLRDGDDIYRTYVTNGRGLDRINWLHNILDYSVYGRQESWETSPPGWPQYKTHNETYWER